MTEIELRQRGFPEGDRQLIARYCALIGAAPAFALGLDPEWRRSVMFELVTAAATRPPRRRRRTRLLEQVRAHH